LFEKHSYFQLKTNRVSRTNQYYVSAKLKFIVVYFSSFAKQSISAYVNYVRIRTRKQSVLSKEGTRAPSKVPVVSLSKKLYPYCLVLVGFRNRFER